MSLINMEPREKVLHSGATATGNGEILELNSEFGGLSVQISGITSATITFEGTVDGNWVEQRAVNKTTGAVATTATADGIYLFDVVGIRKFRARISAYVSGTVKVTANAVLVVPHIPELNVAGAIPAGTNVVGKVGIDQTANGVQLTDGTNTASILANGKVPVDLTLTGDTSLAANVAIQDGTEASQKLSVDANGKAAVKAADLESAIGTAVASPAANTLLARIKNLEDKLAAIIAGTSPAVVQLSGSILEEQLDQSEAVANVLTFTENITAIEIYHEESTWQDFVVNGITLKIPAGGYRTPIGGTAGATVTIPAGINCLVGRLV